MGAASVVGGANNDSAVATASETSPRIAVGFRQRPPEFEIDSLTYTQTEVWTNKNY